MKKMRITTNELRELKGFKNQVEANGVMNLLRETGNAVDVGKNKPNGRGKPSRIYEIPQVVTIEMFKDSDFPKEVKIEAEVEEVEQA